MSKAKRTFESTLKDIIRRNLNDSKVEGTSKLKWVLAGIKLMQLEKVTGSPDHGSGFAQIDRDDDDDDHPEEEGAPDGGHGTATGNGERPA